MKTPAKKPTAKKGRLIVDVLDINGGKKGTVVLSKEVFGAPINTNLLAQAVRVHRMNTMQGTSKAKTRGEVEGSGVKIYKQKGTGRARHGDRYAPIFVGGGIAFGPRQRIIERTLSKTMKKKALISAFSLKIKEKTTMVVEGIDAIEAKTASLVTMFKNLTTYVKHGKLSAKVLLVTGKTMPAITLGGRNIQKLSFVEAKNVSTYTVLDCKQLILDKDAIAVLTKRLTI